MIPMIRPRPPTAEEVRDRMQQYHEQIAPFVLYIAEIEAFRPPPRILLHPDGNVELGALAPLPQEAQELSDRCRDAINTIRKSLFPDSLSNILDDS